MTIVPSALAALRPSPLLMHTLALTAGWLLLMRTILGVHSGVWPASPLFLVSDELREYFADDVDRLGRLLDRDLSGWLA